MGSKRTKGRPTGAPPKYNDPAEMQAVIDAYFASCEGEPLRDEEGKIMRSKYGDPIYAKAPRPPTVTGLALALGFASRQALLNYQAKARFHDTITRAKSRIEAYTEERLFDRDGVHGAKFSLTNNFKGWRLNPVEEIAEDGKLPELLEAVKKLE